ncbi:hypothetical protein ONZ45_g17617 [Pleurotus djamor]|nr:hypothetical protein ONZ45_g17617 [Pleurotus djamor]
MERSTLVPAAQAALAGLSITNSPTSSSLKDSIDHANLSLSCLTHLIQFDGPVEDTLMPLLLEQQELIFSWISFLLLLQNDLLDTTQALAGLSFLSITSAIFGYFAQHLAMDSSESINVHTSNVTVELWHRLQATPIAGTELLTLVEAINNLVGYSLRLALGETPIGDFVEKFGGVSRIPALYAASLDKYLQNISPNPTSELDCLFLVFTLQNTSTLIYLLRDDLLPYSILSEDTIHQVNQSIKYLCKHHSQIDPSVMERFEDTTASYFRFIFECPTTSSYYPILDMLQLGIADHFRAIEYRISVIEKLSQLLGFYAKFPAALPLIERFVRLPANSRAAATWAEVDILLSAHISIWHNARCDAKQYTGCTICQRNDWEDRHRWLCEIFRLCGTGNPLIRTNNMNCLFYLSELEKDRDLQRRAAKYALSAGTFPVPATEIPLLHYFFDLQPDDQNTLKRFRDFPELFEKEKIRQVVVPRIKDFIHMKAIPEYLTVLSLHVNEGVLPILSPSIGLIIGDLATIKERDVQSQTSDR